jgi:hypothetical protein
MEEIIPLKNLGDFHLEDSINKILTIIKQKGDLFRRCDVVFGNKIDDPIYLNLLKEGIKLRFNSITQRLELIEKNFSILDNLSSEIDYYYNNKLVFSTKNKEHIYYSSPDYDYINSIFGFSKVPKFINNYQNILLPYDGISFIFKNNSQDLESNNIDSNCLLEKMLIFSESNLNDAINKDNSKLNCPSPLIKYSVDKNDKIQINFFKKNDNINITISFNETLVDLLDKLQNPNYIHSKKINENNSNNEEINCYYVNYFDYGIDFVIDAENDDKIKKIILHTNNPFDSKFGIYEKCNFKLEMSAYYFKKNINFSQDNLQLSNFKFSNVTDNQIDKNYSILNTDNLTINKNIKIIETKDNNSNNINNKNEKEIDNKLKCQKNVNSVSSDFEIITKNKNDKKQIKEFNGEFQNIVIHPLINFTTDVLEKIPNSCYKVYQKYDNKINRTYKYYLFEEIIFEIMENNMISSIIINSNQKQK